MTTNIFPKGVFIKNVDDFIKVIIMLDEVKNKLINEAGTAELRNEIIGVTPFCYVTLPIMNAFLLYHRQIFGIDKEIFVEFYPMGGDVFKVEIESVILI